MTALEGIMKTTRRSVIVAALTTGVALHAGLGSKDAQYAGGTWDLANGTEGKFDTSNEKFALFVPKKGSTREIPYTTVLSLEYGQKAGRRIGATIGWGVTTLGVAALPMLLSKKRKHYLSIGYKSADGKEQGVVIELGKDVTRGTLMAMEARTGKKIEYESEDARKHVGN
jgi:hypothetical protein